MIPNAIITQPNSAEIFIMIYEIDIFHYVKSEKKFPTKLNEM